MTVLPPRRASDPTGGGADTRLVPGQVFGPYRIVRLLGRGGMGEVYEAEQRDQGRRVALKVLNQRLTDPHDRARFLREGQLAASINHPHSVYIFGSEEIAGTPVIAMELLAGGTLKDRVRAEGPLPPAAAVDAILQVVAGLDAAYAGGILHRDIKPANCFVDRDGTVKIGDFGLSIPTEARDVTALTSTGVFHGTPQFAPPERLKGVAPDVRADIYAVGATLYYLLTGRAPFDDTDLMTLLTRIATDVPRSPRELEPRVPRGLSKIVLRCLAKDRAARPPTYAALDDALRPFGSAAPTPATLGLRFVAGAIDSAILSIPLFPLNMTWAFRSAAGPPWWLGTIGLATVLAYYGVLEGLWGASFGKRMAGLHVTTADGQPPGVARALSRAVVFQTPGVIGMLSALVIGWARMVELASASPRLRSAMGWGAYVLIGLLFSTARRRNGFAGVHDLASGTRVVQRLARSSARSVLDGALESAPVAATSAPRYGPYDVVGTLGRTDVGELLLGFDPSLRRHVWIHTLPPGTPAVAPLIRDLGRPGRLRWLNGGRSTSEAWDAYEALDGLPLTGLLGEPRPWQLVRPWLVDLATEIDAGLQDRSLTALSIAHVWITRDGRAKLLDFSAPGVRSAAPQEEPATLASGQAFLASVARSALGDLPADESGTTAAPPWTPLPLSATATLETLARRGFATSSEVVARATALLQGPDRVGRWRRVAPLALCGSGPVGTALLVLLFVPLMSQALAEMPPDVRALNDALTRLSILSRVPRADGAQERAALEVYIAGRFRPTISDPNTWTSVVLRGQRPLAERVVADHANVSADELAMATASLDPFLQQQARLRQGSVNPGDAGRFALFTFGFGLTLIALFGVVWAFVLRGGLLFGACGIVVVTRDGKPASRLRTLWRGLLAWSLVPAVFGIPFLPVFGMRFSVSLSLEVAVPIGLFLLGVAWAVVHPPRGLQDELAGTWLVPR